MTPTRFKSSHCNETGVIPYSRNTSQTMDSTTNSFTTIRDTISLQISVIQLACK
uniref:Uncharacterized protein n=1 Tax=Arundo donax TaxID=35708 RepID=A0A0A9F2S7_ARUDO